MKENGTDKKKELRSKKCKAFKDFGDKTSFHGFRYISEHQSFPLRRFLWSLLILTCFAALIYQIIDRVIYYYEWPVTVNVGVNYNKTLEFPAVTICNQNAFKASLATKHGWYKMIEAMYSTRKPLTSLYGNITLDNMYLNTAHEKSDFIFSCLWKGMPCKEGDFKKVLTDHGVCFTWNSDDGYVSSPGVENGLKLRLNVEQYEYMTGPHDAAGVKILIHHKFDIPRVYALGQAVSTGSNVFAGVQLLMVNNLPSPHGRCDTKELDYVDTYSQGGCTLDCLSKTAAKQCGCRHIYMPSKNGYPPVCTIEMYYSCLKHMLEIFPNVYEEDCKCPVPCTFNAYESDISYASTSMFAAEKFLANNVTFKLLQDLKSAKEVTSRMNDVEFSEFNTLYTYFNRTLIQIEDKLSTKLFDLIEKLEIELFSEFAHVRNVCEWKKWLYGYQEYVVEKNFMRARDAYEERNFHVISLAYTEFILIIENNIRELNSTLFDNDAVRDFLYRQTINKLLNRKEIVKRSLINFTELITAYRTGVSIFNYTYDYAPKSHNDYVVPVYLMNESLTHNNYASKYSMRFESYLNRTDQILAYLDGITNAAHENRNVTDEQMLYGREEFRWLMRNFVYAKSVFYYEVIERPNRILAERHSEFDKKCFSAETVIKSIEEIIQSLKRKAGDVNTTLFTPLHDISFQMNQYFSNDFGNKFDIATNFISGLVTRGTRDLKNLLQLILKDDSDILAKLDQMLSLKTDIYDVLVNDMDSYVYYNFSRHYDFLKSFDEIKVELSSNYTKLTSLVQLYQMVGGDGSEFLKSINNLDIYFKSYVSKMEINNDFIKQNFLQLDIFYKQMSYEEITQQKAYDMFALICDIGGSMGLFLGASLLSVCELLDLFVSHIV